MKSIRLVAIMAAVLLALTAMAGCAAQTTDTPPAVIGDGETTETVAVPTLTVTGTGKLTLTPDMATLNLGVLSSAPTAEDAATQNSELMNALIAAMQAAGIADEDMQTANYNMYQSYMYDPNTGQDNPGDYNVSNTLTVKVRDIDKLSEITDAAVAAGMNQSYGVSFGMQDPDASRDELIALAVADARSQAEAYAAALGKTLGEIVSVTNGVITDDVIYETRDTAMSEAMAQAEPTEKNFQEGTLEQTSTVTIRYRLD